MKKISFFLLCAILLSSCSMTLDEIFLIPTATPTASKTSTVTASPIPSATPTVSTSTFTVTPTPIILRTDTPAPDGSITPTPITFTPFNLITPDTLTPTVVMEGFLRVVASEAQFYKKGCEPGVVKITAQMARPAEVSFVVLFVRFKSRQTGSTSEWTSIGMQHIGAGTYIHDLLPDEMKGVDSFENAWVEYQFVATNSDSVEKGRTEIFSETLTLLECVATPTVTATSTPLKP